MLSASCFLVFMLLAHVSCRLMGVVDDCLQSDASEMRQTVMARVDYLEDQRRSCSSTAAKALFSRLLFVLSRCSRLLVTDEVTGAYGGAYEGAAAAKKRRMSALGAGKCLQPFM